MEKVSKFYNSNCKSMIKKDKSDKIKYYKEVHLNLDVLHSC